MDGRSDPGEQDLFQSSVIHLCQWTTTGKLACLQYKQPVTPNQTKILGRKSLEGCRVSAGTFNSLLWNVTHLRYSSGSRAAGSQSSVFRSNQEMRAGLGPAHPGGGEPVRGLASGNDALKKKYTEALPPSLTSRSQVRTLGPCPHSTPPSSSIIP